LKHFMIQQQNLMQSLGIQKKIEDKWVTIVVVVDDDEIIFVTQNISKGGLRLTENL
jgi:hypothetical protein